MILTTRGRYAVMAVVDMVEAGSGKPISLSSISKRQNISLSYLEQIFSNLRKAGIVKSVKGPGGGYTLGKSSAEVKISNIIKAIGEPIKMTRCGNEAVGCMAKTRCKTHDLWHGLEKTIYLYFESISINDICNQNLKERKIK
jgi:Rrf2 family iron-sulfur cluster assembly transcriptional regulator